MTIAIRRAVLEDKPRILDISAQVWDGTDYVPNVIDRWLKQLDGLLWVAETDGQVAGFSRMTFLAQGRFWMEGIRVDQAFRGKGIGKALTDFQIEEGFKLGYESAALSSFIENYESLQIVRSRGFCEAGRFKCFDCQLGYDLSFGERLQQYREETAEVRRQLLEGAEATPLTAEDLPWVYERLSGAEALGRRSGYLSYDWTFEKPDLAFLEERLSAGDWFELKSNGLSCLLSVSGKHAKGRYKTVNFVEHEALEPVALSFALERMLERGELSLSYMAVDDAQKAAFETIGMGVYVDAHQDVFVFEKREREEG